MGAPICRAMAMNSELELLRIFRAAAEASSFRDAAVRLGSSPQAVTRAIQSLESHYGELLFHRNTRQMRITGFGEALLARLRPALEQFDAVWQSRGTGLQESVSGTVRVSAPQSLGVRAILPALKQVAAVHPGVTLDVRLSDRISDAVDEKIDVGLRVGFMHDNRFVARKAADMRLFTVASPALIRDRGLPADMDALSTLPVTASLDPNTGRPWPWYFRSGRQWTPAHPALVADDADLEMGAVLEGIAFGQIADYMAAPHIARGELVRVLREEEPEPWGLYVYRPQRGPVAPRVRVVFDALVDAVATLAASLPEPDARAGRTRKRRS